MFNPSKNLGSTELDILLKNPVMRFTTFWLPSIEPHLQPNIPDVSLRKDWNYTSPGSHQGERCIYTPAEVQQGPSWLWNILIHPGQEVELSYGTCLVGLDVLQVETAHQEVLAPDVLWHQVDLEIQENDCIPARMKSFGLWKQKKIT